MMINYGEPHTKRSGIVMFGRGLRFFVNINIIVIELTVRTFVKQSVEFKRIMYEVQDHLAPMRLIIL